MYSSHIDIKDNLAAGEEGNKEREDKPPVEDKVRFKVRFDYRGTPRPARFFFGGKSTVEMAEEIRDQQVALWRNVPIQGITVEDMEMGELYKVYDEESEGEIAYAPLELVVLADSLEEMIRFAAKEE